MGLIRLPHQPVGVKTPQELRTVDRDDGLVDRRDYDGNSVIVADLGVASDDLAVDIVDETAIIVAGDDQIEFELPEDADEVSVNNGIVTIEG